MRVHLKPEQLGDLHLKIVEENGILSAHLQAQSNQVRQILEASLPRLSQQLEEAGVKLDKLTISLGQNPSFSGQESREGGYPARSYPQDGILNTNYGGDEGEDLLSADLELRAHPLWDLGRVNYLV